MKSIFRATLVALLLIREPLISDAQVVNATFFKMLSPGIIMENEPFNVYPGDPINISHGIKNVGKKFANTGGGSASPNTEEHITSASFKISGQPYLVYAITIPSSNSTKGNVMMLWYISLPSMSCMLDALGTQEFALEANIKFAAQLRHVYIISTVPVTINYN